jgi:hypothetical protein
MGLSDLADRFISYIVWAYRLPSSIISDLGSLFISIFWKWIIDAIGTIPDLSTTFYAETDG